MANDRVDVRQLKDLVSIEQVVAACGVQLHPKSGGEFSCLCPFHKDHNPSMSVVPRKKFAVCHSCGWSGDAIAFAQEHRGATFREACDFVAGLEGLSLDQVSERAEAQLTSEQRAERQRRREAFEAQQAQQQHEEAERKRGDAAELWESAAGSENHEALWAYFRSRGIAMKNVRTLPASLRFLERMRRNPQKEDEAGVGVLELPGLLAAMIHPDRPAGTRVVALQRIYFRPDGEPGKWNGGGDAKLTLGKPCKGARIVLRSPKQARTLIVCEGVETGMAIVDAVSAEGVEPVAVWSVLSTAGLKNIQLTEDDRAKFTRVIIAADADRIRWKKHGDENIASAAGLDAAFDAKDALVEAGVQDVRIVPPTPEVAKVSPFGWPSNKSDKSVDWLDAVADEHAGKLPEGAVCAAIMQSAGIDDTQELRTAMANRLREIEGRAPQKTPFDFDPTAGVGDEGGGGSAGGHDGGGVTIGEDGREYSERGRPIMPKAPSERAMRLLKDVFLPSDQVLCAGGGAAWPIAWFMGEWWVWTGHESALAPRYVTISQDLLNAKLRVITEQYDELTRKEVVDKHTGERRMKMVPKQCQWGARTMDDVLEAMKAFVAEQQAVTPMWRNRHVDSKRRTTGEIQIRLDPDRRPSDSDPDPRLVVAFQNTLIDTDAFLDDPCGGLIAHTPRWFSTACLKHTIDVKSFAKLASKSSPKAWMPGGEIDRFFADKCPVYMNFVRTVLRDIEDQVQVFEEFGGYLLTGDTQMQRLAWIQGPSGGGKSVLAKIYHSIVGVENVAMVDMESLGGRFETAELVKKRLVHMDEARTGAFTNTAAALDTILRITGGEPVRAEGKTKRSIGRVDHGARFVFTLNEEPGWKDAAGAITRRMLLMITGPQVEKPDRNLSVKLQAEMQWIAMRMLIRLRDLRLRGDFVQPAESVPIIAEMGLAMDDVKRFVDECVEFGEAYTCRVSTLFEAFRAYYKDLNHQDCEMRAANFGKKLNASVGIGRVKTTQVGSGRDRYRVYSGLRLKDFVEQKTLSSAAGTVGDDEDQSPF